MAKKKDPLKEAETKAFFEELGKNEPNFDKLAEIMEKNPDLLVSREFLREMFPRRSKEKASLGAEEDTTKIMQAVRAVKTLEAKGSLSPEQTEAFLSARNPKGAGQDTVVSCVVRNAYEADIKSTDSRMPESGQNKFAAKLDVYRQNIEELQNLGIDMTPRNNEDKILFDKAAPRGLLKSTARAAAAPEKQAGNALSISPRENEGASLEVDGKALNFEASEPAKKPVNVQAVPTPEESEKEATIEEAPEEDKPKKGEHNFKPIREQDIIDFMYNEWFLAGLSWALGKVVSTTENSIDNLCEKYARRRGKDDLARQKQMSTNTKNAVSRGQEILNMPNGMSQQFNRNMVDRFAELNNDVRNNVGKTPQEWKSLDPNNPNDKATIDKVNSMYAANPQGFMKNMDAMQDRMAKESPMVQEIYKIALEAATVEYMQTQMNKKHVDFIHDDDKTVQDTIAKQAMKNFQQITVGVKAIAEHTALAAQAYQGVTDQRQLDDLSQTSVASYMALLKQQTARAKAATLDDLKDGNFKYNGNAPTNSTLEADKLTKLFDQSEKAGEILAPHKQAVGEMTLAQEATHWNTREIAQGNIRSTVTGSMDAIRAQQAENSNRRANLNAYKAKVFSAEGFKKYHEKPGDNKISQIISQTLGRQ